MIVSTLMPISFVVSSNPRSWQSAVRTSELVTGNMTLLYLIET